jgi:fumarate reductase flavoprotein subunit
MPGVIVKTKFSADIDVDCLIIGGGAAGMTAALAASETGVSVLVAERETRLSGSTALSSGLIPAAGTKAQDKQLIEDSADVFYADIMSKNKNTVDPNYVQQIVRQIPKTIDWLADDYCIPFHVLDNFLYPSHTNHRMHTVPEKTGVGLINRLEAAVLGENITIAAGVQVTDLVVDHDGKALGAICLRPDGACERIAAKSIILACNGYGANPDLINKHIPEMKDALYFGHPGNQGEAVLWGESLGAGISNLSGYQGHGSVAHPHGILVTWALMMEGGIQINKHGVRFSNEHNGYSEQAVSVLGQDGKIAFNIFDKRLVDLGREFDDFNKAENSGAIIRAKTSEKLAHKLGIDHSPLKQTLADCEQYAADDGADPFGRRFEEHKLLTAPYYAVKVTGALFHTQGGLIVNHSAQICRPDGSQFDNIFACGGAACGVSGPDVSGYLSGNGLLTALSLGEIAGRSAGNIPSTPS